MTPRLIEIDPGFFNELLNITQQSLNNLQLSIGDGMASGKSQITQRVAMTPELLTAMRELIGTWYEDDVVMYYQVEIDSLLNEEV